MAQATSRIQLLRHTMQRDDWMRLGGFGAVVLGINLVGWALLLWAVVATHSAIGLGVGLTAWTFGLRHAFDADHIAAIDNTTRKLMTDGRRPLGVGFFFSLGHSTIVFALSFAIVIAAKLIAGQVGNESDLKNIGGLIGTSVSAFFLYLIAIINLVILVGIYRIFQEMRHGRYDEQTLEQRLQERGFINRLLGPLARSIRHSWQMYPLGVLFGLGFDTATEVGLLALAGGAAAGGLPWFATLSLPILFAGGMSLMDTADGAFMNVAYGWAFSKPVRKVFYNRAVGRGGVAHRDHRAAVCSRPASQPQRRNLGLGPRSRPEHGRLPHRRLLRAHLGGGSGSLEIRAYRGALVNADTRCRRHVGRWILRRECPCRGTQRPLTQRRRASCCAAGVCEPHPSGWLSSARSAPPAATT